MPMQAIEAYLTRLPARQAEMKLLMSDAISIPHVKESARNNMLAAWMRAANVFTENAARPASPARLKLMGIGVRYVRL